MQGLKLKGKEKCVYVLVGPLLPFYEFLQRCYITLALKFLGFALMQIAKFGWVTGKITL
jgi:hypothetical protein